MLREEKAHVRSHRGLPVGGSRARLAGLHGGPGQWWVVYRTLRRDKMRKSRANFGAVLPNVTAIVLKSRPQLNEKKPELKTVLVDDVEGTLLSMSMRESFG